MQKKKETLLLILSLSAFILISLTSFLPLPEKPYTAAGVFIQKGMADCQDGSTKCLGSLAKELVKNYSTHEILKTFEVNEQKQEFYANCHTALHFVGQEIYKQSYGLPMALNQCTHVCFEACLHGTVEGYLSEKNLDYTSSQVLSQEIPLICGERENYQYEGLFNQCIHGIGHALMYLTQSDLPFSLESCDYLKNGPEREWCYSGAFMENSNSSTNKDHPSKFVKKDDPFFPCKILDKKYLKMCYELQSFKFYDFARKDWIKTIALCKEVPTDYRQNCYKSIGSMQVGFSQDNATIINNCNLFPSEEKNTCINAVVATLATRFGGNEQVINNFCSELATKDKIFCYTQMGISLAAWISKR